MSKGWDWFDYLDKLKRITEEELKKAKEGDEK